MKILVVEDTPSVSEAISLALGVRWPDATILSCATGEQGVDVTRRETPDAIILDLGLPDIGGFEVLKRIRQFSDVPILILTVRSDEIDIVRGLEWGADDYVVKPFSQIELLARVNAIVRRRTQKGEKPLVCGQLRFEPGSSRLVNGSEEVKLSHTEGVILGQLMRNPGNVVSTASMAEAIWGSEFPEASDGIRVHIRHLRQKLEADPGKPRLILNKPGVGYFLAR